MGKGKELATEANHRLDNFQTQLVDVLKLINTDMEALKNEVKANFDEKLNELEDRLTKKFEDNLSSLEKDFDKVITDMDSKIEDITQALPFMEIKIEDAQTKLKNSQRAGLTLVRDLEDKHKTKETIAQAIKQSRKQTTQHLPTTSRTHCQAITQRKRTT